MSRFSVLLPTHNRADVPEFAIRSVLWQTRSDFEVLVVGDGCTDGTADLVTRFADPRIRWFDLPKAPGFGYANRNIALREATGEIVCLLGHDDLLFPDHLHVMDQAFRSDAAMMAYTRPLWFRDDGLMVPAFINLSLPGQRYMFLNKRNLLPTTCIAYRRAVHDEIGMWDETLEKTADWDLWKRIIGAHPNALRMLRDPTSLHFRADRRPERNWAVRHFGYLFAVADSGGYWPAGLKLEIDGEGASPQAQTFAQIDAAPIAFARQARLGVLQLQDHLAWNTGQDPNFC